jgi:hypothetical protein
VEQRVRTAADLAIDPRELDRVQGEVPGGHHTALGRGRVGISGRGAAQRRHGQPDDQRDACDVSVHLTITLPVMTSGWM